MTKRGRIGEHPAPLPFPGWLLLRSRTQDENVVKLPRCITLMWRPPLICRSEVIQKSARQEFEAARFEKDPELVRLMGLQDTPASFSCTSVMLCAQAAVGCFPILWRGLLNCLIDDARLLLALADRPDALGWPGEPGRGQGKVSEQATGDH